MKPIEFLGNSLDALREFPKEARRQGGFQLDKVQRGLEPDDWKPMKTVGPGVAEIRVRDVTGAFRVIYLARLDDAVYVLNCFEKKAQRTPQSEIKLARTRFKEAIRRQQ